VSNSLGQQNLKSIGTVATLTLGSRPRQKACKGVSQEKARESRQKHCKGAGQEDPWESHHILPRMLESVREYEEVNLHTPKEMESRWTPKYSESNCRGQNSMSCDVLYIIGKLLKLRCLKWACIAHLDIWNTSYGQKKGQESNCQFDSRPQKVKNRPNLLSCMGRATYRWKALNESYNFASNRIAIWGLLTKLWGSKVAGVPFGAISGLPVGSLGKNSHLDVASVESCRVYYKGEGGGFPQVRAVVSLVCPCCRGSS